MDLAPLLDALDQMGRVIASPILPIGRTLQDCGVSTFWRYLLLVSLPVLVFLALDSLTNPRR